MERRLHLEILADGSYRTMSDEDAWWYGYAARYAEYTQEQIGAAGLTVEEYWRRNGELLARVDAIERKRAEAEARQAPTAGDDIIAPAGTTSTRRSWGTGRCGRCGREGSYWNPGAGAYLCERHWDAY